MLFTAGGMTLPGVRKGGTMQQQEFIQAVRDAEINYVPHGKCPFRNEVTVQMMQEALKALKN